MLAQVPLPGIDRQALAQFFQNNSAFGILDLFAGGGLSQLSIVGLAMNPYFHASIIMQLMTGVIPSLQALSREGEYGRQKINQYTRYLTVPMAILQAFGILSALNAQNVIIGSDFGLGNPMSWVQMITLVADLSRAIVSFFQDQRIYAILYFALTVGFTYFYTAFTFKPDETAEQLRKNGGFIPGIRPGRPTQEYLGRVVSRITLAGALFLGIVAVAPVLIGVIDNNLAGLAIGGTGLLIVVSVVVETMKQIEAQLMMRNYEGFIR
jgi:preprotein translocase subunit SecY